ncbi:MAG: N-acetylmuramoyl-L-alanine amidase [Alphaproteobacteria bacterium]|nr:N-acetylmuramoyl-L-alanine amidase [Alphaproteobacteria bacterium]
MPSPNHGARPDDAQIDMLVLHYTGMRSRDEALERLCDPAAEVSAHYLIDEAGGAFQLVDEDRRAWHAGRATWSGEADINSCSIGIELVNPGHEFGYRAFPNQQMEALESLCANILARHPIPACRVLGHSDVAPSRKEDPGELFDWRRLALAGIGVWPKPDPMRVGHKAGSVEALRADLARLGYAIEVGGQMDYELRSVILAFQRHWLPDHMTGARDPLTRWRLDSILKSFADTVE